MGQNERSFFRYMPVSPAAKEWGIYVVNAGHAVVPPGSAFPTCRHPADHHGVGEHGRVLPTYQFLYIAAGKGEFESKATGKVTLTAGDLVVLQPGMWHRYRPLHDIGWHEYWFEFGGDLAHRWMNRREFLEAGPVFHIGPAIPFLDRMLDLLHHPRLGGDLVLGAFACEAIAEVLAHVRQIHEADRPVGVIVREAKTLLAEGHRTPMQMQDFAERLNMSYSAFRRLFKAHTGYSPRQFVLETKMQWAKEMLATNDATVHRIAEEAGFQSAFYFMRLFKRREGMTPSSYREVIRRPGSVPLEAPTDSMPRRQRRSSGIRGKPSTRTSGQ
jgi:AraC-like DNA-binding protein/mannose-6-phosphate isomerase-like protein (cupin superfamily)